MGKRNSHAELAGKPKNLLALVNSINIYTNSIIILNCRILL